MAFNELQIERGHLWGLKRLLYFQCSDTRAASLVMSFSTRIAREIFSSHLTAAPIYARVV